MELQDFRIGGEFVCGERRWRCTDIGRRVIVAICLEPRDVVTRKDGVETRRKSTDPADLNGPTYSVAECVFDEYEMTGCEPVDEG